MIGMKGTIALMATIVIFSIITIWLVAGLNSPNLPYAPNNPITLP